MQPKGLQRFKVHQSHGLYLVLGLILSVIVAGANPFAGETLAPLDILVSSSGFESIASEIGAPKQAVNGARSDLIDSRYPAFKYVKDSLWAGHGVPRWRFTSLDPMPFTIFNVALDPKIFAFMAIPNDGLGLYVGCLAQLFLMWLGVYLLLRPTLPKLAAFVGGAVYMTSAFNTAWLFDLSVQIWIPWMFWATTRYLQTENRKWLVALCFFNLLSIYSGFYAVSGWALYAVGLLLLFWNFSHWVDFKTFLKKTGAPILACIASFPLAISNFVPLLSAYTHANLSWRTGYGPLEKSYLGQFFNPHHLSFHPEALGYCGVLAFVTGIMGLTLIGRLDRGAQKLYRFYFFFFVFVCSILFGFVPASITNQIPLFSFNPWSRLYSLTSFAIAILCAFGCAALIAKACTLRSQKARASIFVLGAAVFAVQMWDGIRIFRHFNAITRNDWFYPETPSIAFVKSNTLPHQTVLADNSYLIGGTLGPYGLIEWFAHGTVSPTERVQLESLVKHAFKTPFAASFAGSDVDFRSPLLQAFGVRYILGREQSFDGAKLDSTQFSTHRLESTVRVIENLKAPAGAYWVQQLGDSPEQIKTSGLRTVSAGQDTIQIELDEALPKDSWVVVPTRAFDGWKAISDSGQELEVQKFLGIFPAARIKNSSIRSITLKFQPRAIVLGLWINYLLVIIYIGAALYFVRPSIYGIKRYS
jgi:hypothetical protein